MGRKAKQIFFDGKLLHFHDGRSVIRVSEDSTNKLYVLFRDGKKVTTRRDISEIATEFFRLVDKDKWAELRQHSRPITVGSDDEIYEALRPRGEREVHVTFSLDGDNFVEDVTRISAAEICQLFGGIYHKDPVKAERLSGIVNLSKLASMDWGFHGRSSEVTLDDILACYRRRIEEDGTMKQRNKARYIREAESWLGEFRWIVDKAAGKRISLLSELEKAHILKWIDEVTKVATQPEYIDKCKWLTPKQKQDLKPPFPKKNWARQRKAKIITLLTNFVEVHQLETDDQTYKIITNLTNLISKNKKLGKVAVKPAKRPQAADVAAFQQAWEACDLRWRCYLALAINCSFTLSEIADLEKADLDLDKGEMIQDRPKTGEFRAAKLHPLTCSLLQQFNKEHNGDNHTPYFFTAPNSKGQLNVDTMRDSWRTRRKKAGLSSKVTFKRFRKSVATVATAAGCNEPQTRLLMGHTLNGELGSYVETAISTVAPACKAVCEKYFEGLE